MPPYASTNAVRQSLRLHHHSSTLKTLPPSIGTTNHTCSEPDTPRPYVCPFSTCTRSQPSSRIQTQSLRPKIYQYTSGPCDLNQRSSVPRPTRPLYSLFTAQRKNPYSTSAPPPSPQPDLELSIKQFHEQADLFIEGLLVHLEQLQEERADVDCEYSVSLPFFVPDNRLQMSQLRFRRVS